MPRDWSRIQGWLDYDMEETIRTSDKGIWAKKNEEIPTLGNYTGKADEKFWDKFPKCELPKKVKTDINISELEKRVMKASRKLSKTQMKRAKRCIYNLRNGANSCQKSPELPAIYTKNAKSAFLYGEGVTDSIVTFVKKGFVSGPFNHPPLKKFRVNPLMAIPQGPKCRPVLNVSLPAGKSFNHNVDERKMEKVNMSSARKVGYTIMEAGKHAFIAKIDLCDAYKNVPAPIEDLRLQGFEWLGKFFVENRQIFGAKTAVANFDILGKTLRDVACANSDVPDKWVHRQLDDVPIVCPKGKVWCEKFLQEYADICKACNIRTAEECKKFDKAFGASTFGKILGIWFDTVNLNWMLPEEKREKTLAAIQEAQKSEEVDILKMQKLMGRLNDICLMSPFLEDFKKPLNGDLGFLQKNPEKKISLNKQAKKDLKVFEGFLAEEGRWNPIPPRKHRPPVQTCVFSSDAAGWAENQKENDEIGCASIGLDREGRIVFAERVFWPAETLKIKKDGKGSAFGSKTTTLEFLGVLLPFIIDPNLVSNKHVILKVDNLSCVFGWENKGAKNDICASILIRALHLISTFLGSVIYVEHLPRMSSWEACLVDRLSRQSSTSKEDLKLLNSFSNRKIPVCLENWLMDPKEDWDLATNLLKHVQNVVK